MHIKCIGFNVCDVTAAICMMWASMMVCRHRSHHHHQHQHHRLLLTQLINIDAYTAATTHTSKNTNTSYETINNCNYRHDDAARRNAFTVKLLEHVNEICVWHSYIQIKILTNYFIRLLSYRLCQWTGSHFYAIRLLSTHFCLSVM